MYSIRSNASSNDNNNNNSKKTKKNSQFKVYYKQTLNFGIEIIKKIALNFQLCSNLI